LPAQRCLHSRRCALAQDFRGNQPGSADQGERRQRGERPRQVAKSTILDEDAGENLAQQRGLADDCGGREQSARHGEYKVSRRLARHSEDPEIEILA
jgi:hypothetical protein